MRKIYKYPVPITDDFDLELPIRAKILHFGDQSQSLYIWALIDPDAKTEIRHFRLAGTGHPIDEPGGALDHVGCVVGHKGMFVWNLFERKE